VTCIDQPFASDHENIFSPLPAYGELVMMFRFLKVAFQVTKKHVDVSSKIDDLRKLS
jgi:hypothetical protein